MNAVTELFELVAWIDDATPEEYAEFIREVSKSSGAMSTVGILKAIAMDIGSARNELVRGVR